MDQVVRQIKRGNDNAFREIITEHKAAVRLYYASRIRDHQAVEDLTQECFIAVFKSIERYQEGTNLAAWIMSITKNKYKDWVRKQNSSKESIFSESIPLIEWMNQHMQDTENPQPLIDTLYLCIEKLPKNMGNIIKKRYLEQHAVQEIAQDSDSTVSAISSHLYRARALLKDCIGL